MNQHGKSAQVETQLTFHASGFIVKVQGSWTDVALQEFRQFLRLRRLLPTDDQLMSILQRAKREYVEGQSRLSVCTAQPCSNRIGFDISDRALRRVAREIGVRISKTGCQGPCKQAPVVSLRVGKRSEMFGQVASSQDWELICNFAGAAAKAGTVLIGAGEVGRFRYDPVHEGAKPGAHLKQFQFLVGHFRGEGKYAMTPYSFQKEVIGTLEAGGRFLALRMHVAYPLADGRQDVHRALVIAGAEPASGKLAAHAYTDAGLIRQYSLENRQDRLEFEDQPPGHEGWLRARKILQPNKSGFEERLEVAAGDGNFVPYYVIPMRKVIRP